MKIIIPCAGLGTRMLPQSKNLPKILIPHEGKPIISHIIESLSCVAPDPRYVFVISPRRGHMIQEYIAHHHASLDVKYSVQSEPLGFGHAVLQAKEYIIDEPVLIHASDIVLDFQDFDTERSWMAIRTLKRSMASGVLGVRDGHVTNIIEKAYNFWLAVCYIRETSLLFQTLQAYVEQDVRTEGEYQMTDALMSLIRSGITIEAKEIPYIYK